MIAASSSKFKWWQLRLLWVVLITGIFLLRIRLPPRSLTTLGPVALRDLLLTLLHWAVTLLLILGLGKKILVHLPVRWFDKSESMVFAFAIGSGVLAYLLLVLAAVGWLHTIPITVLMIGLASILAPTLSQIIGAVRKVPSAFISLWRNGDRIVKGILVFSAAIGFFTLINTLTPPWDYDGLAYHLVGPLQFIEAGRLFPSIDNWFLNGPFTVEMLYTLGLAYGDDILPKLIHLSMGFFLVASTFILAKRWIGTTEAWLSVAVLLSVPMLPTWSSLAYIDVGWSLFEFLALGAALIAWQESDPRWLVLSGSLIGFAMGSKYLGLIGFGLIGLVILVVIRRLTWRERIRAILLYAVTAILIASPWYIKNMAWFGNPVYPFYFGGPEGDMGRLAAYAAYLNSFGTDLGFWNTILLPLNIYTQHAAFGTLMGLFDVPSIFFPIVFFYPFQKRKHHIISALLWISAGRFFLWAMVSQQNRFLLPIYPPLAIATAYIALRLIPKRASTVLIHHLLPILIVSLMSIALATQIATLITTRPVKMILGIEEKQSFLMRTDSHDFPAIVYIQDNLPTMSRVLLLGDGRSYYCLDRCISDTDQFRWAYEIASLQSDEELASWLQDLSISHILLISAELDFLLEHDPLRIMMSSLDKLHRWLDQGCLTEIYKDSWASLYEVMCR